MTSINVKFRPSTVSGLPGSIIYAIIHKRVVRQVTSDYKIYVYEWDDVNSNINTSLHDERADYRQNVAQRIKWDIARFKRIIDDFKMKNLEYTADEIIEIFNQKSQHLSFFKYMQGIINRLRQLNKRGTADNYQYTLQSFSSFNSNSDLQFEEITISLIEEYEAWLSTNGVKPNSSSFYIRNLRAVYNRAVEDNLIEDAHPFRKAFTGVTKTAKRAISLNDIKKIKALDLSFNEQLQFSRDIFLFQFYCMGISFIDVAFLKLTNIVGNIISYRRHKTN